MIRFAPISEPITHTDGHDTCEVTLSLVDALSVGLSLQALGRHEKTPHGTREIYARVGRQMASAARAAMSQKSAVKTAHAADVVAELATMGGAR